MWFSVFFVSCCFLVSSRKPSLVREIVSLLRWMELDWICVTHWPYLSLLMCFQRSGSEFDSWAAERLEWYYQQWGRTHECVAAGASLLSGRESSWQSVTRLFSPVCLSVHQIRGLSWTGASGCPLSRAQSLSLPISSCCCRQCPLYFSLHNMRWFLGDGVDYCRLFHTTHEMLTGLSKPLIDWPSFTARCGLLIGLQLPADTVTLMEENYCCLVMH